MDVTTKVLLLLLNADVTTEVLLLLLQLFADVTTKVLLLLLLLNTADTTEILLLLLLLNADVNCNCNYGNFCSIVSSELHLGCSTRSTVFVNTKSYISSSINCFSKQKYVWLSQ